MQWEMKYSGIHWFFARSGEAKVDRVFVPTAADAKAAYENIGAFLDLKSSLQNCLRISKARTPSQVEFLAGFLVLEKALQNKTIISPTRLATPKIKGQHRYMKTHTSLS